MKRILSILLAFVLLFATLPTALAAEGTESENLPEETAVTLMDASDAVVTNRGTWEHANVLLPGMTVSYVPDAYNSDMSADQYRFAITVTQPDQAIQLTATGVAKRTLFYLYSAATLEAAAPTTKNAVTSFDFSGNFTVRHKLDAPGVYYLLARPYNASYTATQPVLLTADLADGDTNENNDTCCVGIMRTRGVRH